ncbi:hypothetical protein, partial [Microvirga massiliensis]|uniref:hypothetical protein n=1 Tax=Microvirga massiliensis TaxID=1033741 RepID=UPI0006602065
PSDEVMPRSPGSLRLVRDGPPVDHHGPSRRLRSRYTAGAYLAFSLLGTDGEMQFHLTSG